MNLRILVILGEKGKKAKRNVKSQVFSYSYEREGESERASECTDMVKC